MGKIITARVDARSGVTKVNIRISASLTTAITVHADTTLTSRLHVCTDTVTYTDTVIYTKAVSCGVGGGGL